MMGAKKYKQGKLTVDMKHKILRKKDYFPKMVKMAFHVITGWENQYGGKQNKHEWDGTLHFSTTSGRNEQKKSNKKQENWTLFE